MPYASVSELPAAVRSRLGTGKKARQWLHVWTSAYTRCTKAGGSTKDCEASAFAQANGVVKAADEEAREAARALLNF
jgi:cation transport regulator ChaB